MALDGCERETIIPLSAAEGAPTICAAGPARYIGT